MIAKKSIVGSVPVVQWYRTRPPAVPTARTRLTVPLVRTVSGDLEVDVDSFLVRDRPHHEYGTGSIKTSRPRSPNQTGPIMNTDETTLLIVESYEKILAPITIPVPSLADPGEDDLATVDITKPHDGKDHR